MKPYDICIALSLNEPVQIIKFKHEHWSFRTYDNSHLDFIHHTDLEYLMTGTFDEAIQHYPELFI